MVRGEGGGGWFALRVRMGIGILEGYFGFSMKFPMVLDDEEKMSHSETLVQFTARFLGLARYAV